MLPDVQRSAENIDRPIRTDWVTVDSDVSAASQSLKDAALGLARILGWLRLSSPEAGDSWPYHLAFQNAKTKDMLASSDVKGGDCYKLLLKASPGDVEREAHLRRVYVFAVDSFGRATLLFGDNLANEFPRFDAASAAVSVPHIVGNASGPVRSHATIRKISVVCTAHRFPRRALSIRSP